MSFISNEDSRSALVGLGADLEVSGLLPVILPLERALDGWMRGVGTWT